MQERKVVVEQVPGLNAKYKVVSTVISQGLGHIHGISLHEGKLLGVLGRIGESIGSFDLPIARVDSQSEIRSEMECEKFQTIALTAAHVQDAKSFQIFMACCSKCSFIVELELENITSS